MLGSFKAPGSTRKKPMLFARCLLALSLFSLAACDPTGSPGGSNAPAAEVVAGLAPPPGRTSAERQARKDYYRGPRGDEF